MAFIPTFISSHLKQLLLSLILLITLFFFLITTPNNPLPNPHHPAHFTLIPNRSLLSGADNDTTVVNPSCESITTNKTNGIINYYSLHSCVFNENLLLSIPSLSLLILLHFYILIKTAQTHFSIVTTKLSSLLNLSPSMAAVTLLALGNGAPDVFASVAAVRGGQYRTGFGAILSAGTFVSAFVVGFVAIYAAPFAVDAGSFVRDVSFYLIAALFLFYVYLSGEIFMWQAVGFVGFYLFFVGFVFWMDFGIGGVAGGGTEKHGGGRAEKNSCGDYEMEKGLMDSKDCEIGETEGIFEVKKQHGVGFCEACGMVSRTWEVPVSLLLNLTIPQTSPSKWNRLYMSANIAISPLALLYACNSFMPLDHPIIFLLPATNFPLWLIVLSASSCLALLHFIVEKTPPKTEQMPVVVVAFVMSVFWISTIAGELLNCLAVLGTLLKLPPAILGLTVLAWGNSVGDLVADVAIAKAGHPAMAMAGCFAGPMFNMLFGLGTALVMQTAEVYPKAYELHFHTGIVIAFVFLVLSLMGSLLVVTWSRFRVPRFWGFCLVGLYVLFTVISLIIAEFSR